MKENWERRRAYIQLDARALTELLEPCFPGRQVVAASRLAGGLANTLYKIHISGLDQPVVLRLYTRDATTCQKDVDLFKLVQRQIPVPQLFHADTTGAIGGVPYTLAEFVRGVMLSEVLAAGNEQEIGDVMVEAGKTLAELSRFEWEQAGFFGPGLGIAEPIALNGESHRAYIEQCLVTKGGALRLGSDLAQHVLEFLDAHAALIDVVEGQATLVHADFNGYNIMVEQQASRWKINALLDWEFAFAGPPLFDVGIMLRNEYRLPPSFTAQFIAGFTNNGGKLPDQWHKLSKLLDLLNLCGLITQAQPHDVMAQDLSTLIQETITRWQN